MTEARKKLQDIIGELQRTHARLQELRAALGPDPDLRAELHAALGCALQDCMEPLLRDLVAAAEPEPGEEAPEGTSAGGTLFHLDLSRNDEATRRLLYDLVVKDHFLPEQLDDPGEIWVPLTTPEQAGLEVFWSHGRWFASWLKPGAAGEEPESTRRELLLLEQDPVPGPLRYREL